jgi:hypothetical protein
MADTIRIALADDGDGYDLMRALAVRGLPARLKQRAEEAYLELDFRREATERLLGDLLPALEDWRHDRNRGAVRVEIAERAYSVGSNADVSRCLADACARVRSRTAAA